jgi:hypothetical protein
MNTGKKFRIWTSTAVLFGATLVGGALIAKTSHSNAKVEAPIFASTSSASPMPAAMVSTYAPLLKEALPEVVKYRFFTKG